MKRLSSSQGFSLAELLISSAIMAFALSAILISFVHNVALNESSRNLTLATSHADHVLESIRNAAATSVSTACSSIYSNNWNWGYGYSTTISSKGLTPLNQESIATTTTTSSFGCGSATMLNITVQVNWNDLQQRAQSQSFQTQVAGL